jgi:DNA-binding MarR family transcriptional regulator
VATPDPKQLEQARQQHIGRLLQRAARDFNARALEKLHARGHTALTLAHTNLLPHLEVDGERINRLAERAGMTKQAAGQLVQDLEANGYVERRPDPTDARAALVTFTPAGWRYLLDAQEVKREIEREYRAALGKKRWAALQEGLEALLAGAPRERER